MNYYYLISYFVLCAIGYVFAEVYAARRGWPATWAWPAKLNNWLSSFKKQPYVKPIYEICITFDDDTVDVTLFETKSEHDAYLQRITNDKYQTDEIKVK